MSKDLLIYNLKLLKKQIYWLDISFQQTKKIGVKKDYSIEEFGLWETLCSRFARSIDFLIRKMFRTIDDYEFENQGTLIDTINNAHKRNFFETIEEIRVMKDIRNNISHEYIEEALKDIFSEVIDATPKLLKIMKNTLVYIEEEHLSEVRNTK